MKGVVLICCISLASFSCIERKETNVHKRAMEPVKIIFDTDLGNDIDDVLALQMLLNYHEQEHVDLLGITLSKANPMVVEYVDGYCNFNNINQLSLGYVYNGVTPNDGKYLKQTLDTFVNGERILHPKRSIRDNIPEGYKLIRKLLAAQPDTSVVLVVVGPSTNISRLLESGSDEYSEWQGRELVRRKVKYISIMAGHYVNDPFPEWNIVNDLESARNVFTSCPVPIVASGWEVGKEILYPHQSIEEDFKDPQKHPLCVSYRAWGEMPYDRPTWDLTSVLYAAEIDDQYFDLSPPGVISIDSEGNSVFSESKNGKHHYLIHKSAGTNYVVNALIQSVTGE